MFYHDVPEVNEMREGIWTLNIILHAFDLRSQQFTTNI